MNKRGACLKKQNIFAAYLLIGIGIYFLLKQLDVPLFAPFLTWPTLLIIIGSALILHSYTTRYYHNLFSGTVVLGLGIHFHGLNNYTTWVDHWAVFPLIVGLAFIVRFLWTKSGFLIGVVLTGVSSLIIFSVAMPPWMQWIYNVTEILEKFWPIAIIVLGFYLLKKKK